MTNRRHIGRREGGFILAEVLVSLILISMTLAIVATTLTFGRRVADAGRVRERVIDAMTGIHVLSEWLGSAVPARQIEAGGSQRALFNGQAEHLTFLTLSGGDAQPGGILAVTIAFARSDRDGALLFMAAPLGIGQTTPTGQAVEQQVLVQQVAAAQFRYFGSLAEGEAPGWRDEWKDASRLPDLVALRAQVGLGPRVETMDLRFRVIPH